MPPPDSPCTLSLGAPGSRPPPGVRHLEAPLGSRVVAVHPAGVPQRGPGEAPKLVDPSSPQRGASEPEPGTLRSRRRRTTVRDSVRHVDRQVGKVDGPPPPPALRSGGSCGPAARRGPSSRNADRRGAGRGAPPARGGRSSSRSRGASARDRATAASMGPKTGGRALAWCSSSGQPPTSRQRGQTAMEELLGLLRRAVCGEQVLQGSRACRYRGAGRPGSLAGRQGSPPASVLRRRG